MALAGQILMYAGVSALLLGGVIVRAAEWRTGWTWRPTLARLTPRVRTWVVGCFFLGFAALVLGGVLTAV